MPLYAGGMRGSSFSIATALGVLFSASAHAQFNPDIVKLADETRELIDLGRVHMPDGQWSLSRSDDGCAVRRTFRLDNDEVVLSINRLQPGLPVQYALFGTRLNVRDTVQGGFTPGSGLAHFTRLASATLGERRGITFAGQPFPTGSEERADERALAPEVRYFVVQGSEDPIVLRTGPVHRALNALADCAAEQLASYGVPLDRLGERSRPVELLNNEEFEAHLRASFPARVQGPVEIRAIVDGEGRVTHCHVATHISAQSLRETACSVTQKHARFEPALDGAGQPMTDFYISRIIFWSQGLPGI